MNPAGKYTKIFNELLSSIQRRTGQTADQVGSKDSQLHEEAMSREATCQVLAKESLGWRLKFLFFHPSLVVPYLIRVRKPKAAR